MIRADRDYNIRLSNDLIINDFDDERTLDEEEALEENEDSTNELSNLQKEGHMPLSELLAKYGYGDSLMENSNSSDQMNEECNNEEEGERAAKPGTEGDVEDDEEEEEEEEEEDDEDEEEDDLSNAEPSLKQFYTEMVKGDKLSTKPGPVSNLNRKATKEEKSELAETECEENFAESEASRTEEARKNNNENSESLCADGETNEENRCCTSGASCGGNGTATGGSSRLLRSVSRPQSEEEEDDCDYSPDEEEWKKTIMVGSDYQAAIPEGLCKYDDALPYENEDKMLWDPSHIPQEQTEEFLERAQLPVVRGTTLPSGSHVRDDEQALYLLLQCGYNLEEALRRRRMNVLPPTDAVSLWSEEECHNFESGLRNYGKDFHLIQKNKVRTRSVGELVQFYYLWKKSERHDIFTSKARLEKKKYALHPGITDYMDRFLEEQEGVRDRSSSPNVHCLMLYGDSKRQKTSTGMNNADDSKSLESWDNNNPGNNATDAAPESVAVKEENLESATEPSSIAKNSILQTSSVHNSTNANATRHVDYASHLIRENNEVAKTTGETTPWTGTTPQQCNSNNNFPTTTSSETLSRTADSVPSLIPP